MKVLLCYSNMLEAQLTLDSYADFALDSSELEKEINKPQKKIIYSFFKDGMNLDIAIVGNTVYETSFMLSQILKTHKYHLALMAGLCRSYSDRYPNHSFVNIIQDKSGEMVFEDDNTLLDLYQVGLLNHQEFPHQRGGYINMTNAYFNVFLDITKVLSITSPIHNYGHDQTTQYRVGVQKAMVENNNGLGFVYACLWHQQPFYQLRLVDYEIYSQKKNEQNSIAQLSKNILEILELIK